MIAFVRVYQVILDQGRIQGNVSEQIRAALAHPIKTATLTSAIDRLVVARLIGAERRLGKWDRVWALPQPTQEQVLAMESMVRARYVLAILQLAYDPSLATALTAAQLEEGLQTHFPYLKAPMVMDRLFRRGLVERPPADQA